MEKYLLIETNEVVELAPLSDKELIVIKPLIDQIAQDKYRNVKSNGQANLEDHERYGQLPGWETLVQFIPDEGIGVIQKIKVVNVIETLLA